MIPVLLKIGPIKIYSYGFMLVVAFFVDYFLLRNELKRRNLDPNFAGDVVMWAAIGGIVGSKIYYMLENYKDFIEDPLGMIFSGAGLVFLGGLIGGMLAVTLLIRRKGYTWLMFADVVAPLLILGYAIGRIGCFLVGDDYGIPTHLPWGLSFPNGIPPTTYESFHALFPWINLAGFEPGILKVHPTQLYETTMGIMIFTFLWKMRTKYKRIGGLFFIYLILAGTERFFIEIIRTNEPYLFGLTGAQVFSLMMIGIGTFFLFRFRKGANEQDSPPIL
ncbi:MAG: prolipoprotein diacylglyceryl transferase [Candidatus Marinimicrobia bacterium]|nr:prolipoprotein diacylglyceryl transferase [Candidatus Neomarinimicrobiota bacterium]MBL7046584.1 prolipoprotein diacylglyceryl transferase [Candidatus Neomarinimicrobiota bacterium]